MAKRQDIKQDDFGDIYINPITGDFDIVESDGQHVGDIMQSITGDYKEFPLLGVNFFLFENSTGQGQNIERIIRTQLGSDVYQVTKVIVPDTVTSVADITIYADGPEI